MSLEAAKMYMYSMVISHIIYCLNTWSQVSSVTLKPLESLYKRKLKKSLIRNWYIIIIVQY